MGTFGSAVVDDHWQIISVDKNVAPILEATRLQLGFHPYIGIGSSA
jgi:hypothetical protein